MSRQMVSDFARATVTKKLAIVLVALVVSTFLVTEFLGVKAVGPSAAVGTPAPSSSFKVATCGPPGLASSRRKWKAAADKYEDLIEDKFTSVPDSPPMEH